ncbi:ABC transporter permease [Oceanibium sediminis]|uniref:ABC transporter permease n=1 Tax=Oceanibium sediminis TaxID=2026339 RepID=UPI001E306FF8|nr:ABC transporter permease [Oceanibium sediminis]
MSETHTYRAMGERRFGRFNALGLRTLVEREIRRFSNVWRQTLLAPVATAALFMTVFSLALTARRGEASPEFMAFLAPGILMMTVIQNAFANTSSSLLVSKVQGNIVDTLMPPLSAAELTAGYVIGGVARGLFVAFGVALVIFPVIGLGISHPIWALAFIIAGATLMATLGVMAATIAQKFDHMSAITNFVVTPLSFLSGTFYSITILPGWMQMISHLNPFFYMIDGIRYGVIGQSDANPVLGILFVAAVDAVLLGITWYWFRTGYKLKP